mgnify:CR=1 FL=1
MAHMLRERSQELLQLKGQRRFADFRRLAVRSRQTMVISGRTGSGKTTFMKGLVEEVPKLVVDLEVQLDRQLQVVQEVPQIVLHQQELSFNQQLQLQVVV